IRPCCSTAPVTFAASVRLLGQREHCPDPMCPCPFCGRGACVARPVEASLAYRGQNEPGLLEDAAVNRLRNLVRRTRGLARYVVVGLVVLGTAAVPLAPSASAQATTTWQVGAGAETADKAIQALAYFPNAIQVNVGDTV